MVKDAHPAQLPNAHLPLSQEAPLKQCWFPPVCKGVLDCGVFCAPGTYPMPLGMPGLPTVQHTQHLFLCRAMHLVLAFLGCVCIVSAKAPARLAKEYLDSSSD